jgi:hypothetical protein
VAPFPFDPRKVKEDGSMSKDTMRPPGATAPTFSSKFSKSEVLRFGREIIRTEADALKRLEGRLRFERGQA